MPPHGETPIPAKQASNNYLFEKQLIRKAEVWHRLNSLFIINAYNAVLLLLMHYHVNIHKTFKPGVWSTLRPRLVWLSLSNYRHIHARDIM